MKSKNKPENLCLRRNRVADNDEKQRERSRYVNRAVTMISIVFY